MSMRTGFSILLVALFALLCGASLLALASRGDDTTEIALEEDSAGLREKERLAQELYGSAEELLGKAEESLNRAARLNERGHEREALEYESRGLELEVQANALRLQAEELIQSARIEEMMKRIQRD